MIRVIYTWQVEKHNFKAFNAEWRKATNIIHQTVPGALGSFMLQGMESSDHVITVAKWDKLESWQAFWNTQTPEEMRSMHKLGKRVSVVAYDEIEDFTR